ncbi:AAA family ATPase [Streptomyces sp. RFCAC02]|uniref:AAA family ATPase n=1 Tax=Streptomyces sp. RFCAC02 TaxID=2499143 RepID=UPI001022156B|nr:AAA family ATPase [Streptomyces sp. RFCAC02]
MSRKVRRITVTGYKSIGHVELALGPVTVLVGPNGAGKSNVIEAVELLGRIADGELGMEVGLRGGAMALLHDSAEAPAEIALRVEADDGDLVNAYEAALVPSRRDELVFGREAVEFHDRARHAQPWNRQLGRGHRESRLADIAGEGQSGAGDVARHTLEILRGCRVFHFHDTTPGAPVKQPGYASDTEVLHPDGRNLAAFLQRLRDGSPAEYRQIVRTVRSVAPFFRDFVLAEDPAGRVPLRWRQSGSDTVFPADALSDGTLRFICLTVLLLQPRPPALLVLDEPELGLHPFAITVLAELFRSASAHSQVLAATQSVTLLDQFALDELVVAERVDGATSLSVPVGSVRP